jgi:type III restriction enzyme
VSRSSAGRTCASGTAARSERWQPSHSRSASLPPTVEDYQFEGANGQLAPSPAVRLHLMSDENGDFPVGGLNEWERAVIDTELARPGALAWYRNPPRATVDAITVPYRDQAGNWRSMHPDFVFFHTVDGEVRAAIVDPHGHHLEDAKIKLKALAAFAAEFGGGFHRIEAVDKVDGLWRVLEMQHEHVREAVLLGNWSPAALYSSDLAGAYDAIRQT